MFLVLAQNKIAMQDDKTLFTEKVSAGKRTYFLDVKENHQGTHIFKLTESRKNNGEYIRHSVMVFQEDFEKIFEALEKVKQFIAENPSSRPNREYPPKDEYRSNENNESVGGSNSSPKEEDLSF